MTWKIVVAQPSQLGESPFWHPDEARLYWVDIAARQICRTGLPAASVERWTLPSEPGCIAPVRANGTHGGLVVALRDGIYRARQWGGELKLLSPAGHDPSTTRFNDGKADPLGRFWAGTIYEPRTAALAQLFSLDCRSSGQTTALQAKAGRATTANGLARSPDGATLYWADTAAHTIRAWDFDLQHNALSNERVFQQFAAKPAGWLPGMAGYGGRPDGAAVDVQGNYYVAMFEGARIAKFAASGQWLADLAVPVRCPTMPCFGGPDLKTLFVTSASHNRPLHELEAYPQSGCIFSMQVDVPGLPVNFFDDALC